MGVMNEDRLTLYDGLIKTHITNTTVAKETGKGLSTNDYTTDEKTKLAGIATGANKTVVDSALDTSSENPVQNKVIAGEINTLKKSVSDGKTLVATAITDKGVETAADATFAVMAENIGQIETGGGELHGATISVTTTEETLIGKTIKLSLNSTTVDTKTFDSNGACSFTDIQEAGTYSLYSTDGTDSKTITVDITAENVINKTVISCEFYLTPDGETITPVDDVAILLKCAEIKDKSYTTMDELLADEQAMGDITMSENAMKYLARSTGFADAVCANETFMTLLGASSYVDTTVLNSDYYWVNAICNSTYFESVLNAKVPTMTSNTEPSGECSASSSYVNPNYPSYPYYAFCGDLNTWSSQPGDNWIQYRFANPVKVNRFEITPWGKPGDNFYNKSYKLQASNNGVDFVDLTNEITQNSVKEFHTILNSNYYLYYRVQCYANTSKFCGARLQFYGRYQ